MTVRFPNLKAGDPVVIVETRNQWRLRSIKTRAYVMTVTEVNAETGMFRCGSFRWYNLSNGRTREDRFIGGYLYSALPYDHDTCIHYGICYKPRPLD